MSVVASLHPAEVWCQIGEARLYLTARPLLAQDNRAPLIEANNVERVPANA
jgi:hypothetical protein